MAVSRTALFFLFCLLLLLILPVGATAPRLYNQLPPYLEPFGEKVEEQACRYPQIFFLHAGPGEKKVALTFDDGPGPFTAQILDILSQYQVPATFFVLGEQLEEYSYLLGRILEEGHVLGNHSWSHPDFRNLSPQEILEGEILPTSTFIQNRTGLFPLLIRPPYGAVEDRAISFLGEEGFFLINWSLDTFDWDGEQNTTEEMQQKIKEYHHPGAIILMHDGENGQAAAKALPHLIEKLQELGYGFQRVDMLLGLTPYR